MTGSSGKSPESQPPWNWQRSVLARRRMALAAIHARPRWERDGALGVTTRVGRAGLSGGAGVLFNEASAPCRWREERGLHQAGGRRYL